MPRTHGAVLAAILASLIPPVPTCAKEACRCAPRSAEEVFASGDTVIDGLVVEVQRRARATIAFVAVEGVYAGDADRLTRVRTPIGPCGLDPRAGERWVMVGPVVDATLRTDVCMGSSRSTTLIAGRMPVADPSPALPTIPVPEDSDRSSAWLAALLAVLATIATAIGARRIGVRR